MSNDRRSNESTESQARSMCPDNPDAQPSNISLTEAYPAYEEKEDHSGYSSSFSCTLSFHVCISPPPEVSLIWNERYCI
ncbi:hypothetical protein Mapa_000999 [Marchantia paleacea]|nr:hypothetical protein Mapa_000999 [Marchantia paleacea]